MTLQNNIQSKSDLPTLHPEQMQQHAPVVGRGPVLEQINVLPGSESQPAVQEWDGQMSLRQSGTDVRGHVVGALGIVPVVRVSIRDEPLEKGIEVMQHIRVGVFLNEQGGGGVLYKEGEQAGVQAPGTIENKGLWF